MRNVAVIVVLLVAVWTALPQAERMGYPPEEFTARRQKLAKALGSGTLLMFGASAPTPGSRFRQDNDFYYLTGNEGLNAALVIDVPSGQSYMFLPKKTAREIRYEGGNWLEEPDAAKKYGFTAVQPLSELQEFLARRRPITGSQVLWTRLSERDYVNEGRSDSAIQNARRLISPFSQHPTEEAGRITALRAQFPYYEMKDAAPQIDRLRVIKSPREIEILRYNGRISAEALKRAMQASAPGKYEYELEAEAKYWLVKHGFQGDAYPAIVGSGPMGNQWHYEDNGRQIKAGEMVVMDYAGSLDYMTMDITRTWPVSGRFTDMQLRAYECALEAQKAIIAAIKPGVTRTTVQSLAEGIYKKHGFDPVYAYSGHYVGMSVHDVGDWNAPFEAGMVLAIEPIIDLPGLHVRIEDSVLVTPTGTEILSAGVPKEVEEVIALLRTSSSR